MRTWRLPSRRYACSVETDCGSWVSPGPPSVGRGRVWRVDACLSRTFQTDWCVAAEPESDGFYDANDVPGWDTWFHCEPAPASSGLLYCYVPQQLVELADRGMWAIPVQWVRWV